MLLNLFAIFLALLKRISKDWVELLLFATNYNTLHVQMLAFGLSSILNDFYKVDYLTCVANIINTMQDGYWQGILPLTNNFMIL